MEVSKRSQELKDSVTLALNAKVVQMADQGKNVINLTAGQLPFKPHLEFVEKLRTGLNLLKSFQYSPAAGFQELRKKLIQSFAETRNIAVSDAGIEMDCVISNGGKHSLSSVLGVLLDPEDEVLLLTPYWLSYPQMIRYWGANYKEIHSELYDNYQPSIEEIKKNINEKTKAIIINSPSNPTGIYYSDEWMKSFAEMIQLFPHVNIISDEIYYELAYFDPRPTYFYQHSPELLKRTIIFDGISKTLASTGLRIGYAIGPKDFMETVAKAQAQTASGASSLVQRALIDFDFKQKDEYLGPIKLHLRENANLLRKSLQDSGFSAAWYQCNSAFYYLIDFTKFPFFSSLKTKGSQTQDYAPLICETILEKTGVAMVPTSDFGKSNSARISLVSEHNTFQEALDLLMEFFKNGKI